MTEQQHKEEKKHQRYFPSCIFPLFLFSSIRNIYKCTSTVGAAVFSLSGSNAVKFTASSNSSYHLQPLESLLYVVLKNTGQELSLAC